MILSCILFKCLWCNGRKMFANSHIWPAFRIQNNFWKSWDSRHYKSPEALLGNIIRSICVVNLYSGSKNGIPWSIRHKYKYINYHFLNRNWNYKGSILYYHPIHTKVSIFQNIKDKTDDCLNCFNITWLVHLCTKNSSTFTLFTKKSELPLFE